jgi:hypothetical protein
MLSSMTAPLHRLSKVGYYDSPGGLITPEYDSTSGEYTPAATLNFEGTNTWKEKVWALHNVKFANRQNSERRLQAVCRHGSERVHRYGGHLQDALPGQRAAQRSVGFAGGGAYSITAIRVSPGRRRPTIWRLPATGYIATEVW